MKRRITAITSAALVAFGSILILESSARMADPPAASVPAPTDELAEQLRENAALQRPLVRATQLLQEHGRATPDDVLAAELRLIEAMDLLNRITGEARDELIKLRTRRVQELEAALSRARRMAESGHGSGDAIAEASQALARERVALFELTR